jgi:hypothetical protein
MSVEDDLFGGRRKSTATTKMHGEKADDDEHSASSSHDAHMAHGAAAAADDDDDDDALRAQLLGDAHKKNRKKKKETKEKKDDDDDDDDDDDHVVDNDDDDDDDDDDMGLNIETLDLGLDTLDLTTVEIDYGEMEREFASVKDHPLLANALRSGNLRQFTRSMGENLATAEQDTVPAILAQADEFALLFNDLDVCDGVLAQFESLLDGFRASLGGLSDDIQRLQDSSVSKSTSLENRKALHGVLQGRLREMTLGKHMTKKLQTAPIDDKYLLYLQDLNRKLSFLAHAPGEAAPNRATADARRTVGEVQAAVVARLRQHLLGALGDVKSIVQLRAFQKRFNRHGAFYQFLFKHENATAQQLLSGYIEHGCRTYNVHLSSYLSSLLKLMAAPTIGKKDLIGVSDDKLKNLFTTKLVNLKREAQPFALGAREQIVTRLFDAPYDLKSGAAAAAAAGTDGKVPYEEIFRSFFFELTELIANESRFIQDFFLVELETLHQQVFGRTLEQFMQHLEKYLASCYDALTILIMLCATGQYKVASNRRMVTILNDYYDNIFTMLITRFKEIVDLHVVSVQKATPKNLGLAPGDALPHYVTRRFAEWYSAVAQLATHMVDDAPVRAGCAPLVDAVKDMLQRLSESINAPLRTVFVINNYALIVKLLEERKANDALLEQPRAALERATRKHTRADVTREFAALVALMNECGYEKATAIRRDHPMAAVGSPAQSPPATPAKGAAAATSAEPATPATPATPAAAAAAEPATPLSPGQLETEYIKLLQVPDSVTAQRVGEVTAAFEKEYEAKLSRLRGDTLQHFASFETGMAVFSAMLAYIFDLYNSLARMVADKFPKVRCVAPENIKGTMQGLVMNFLS